MSKKGFTLIELLAVIVILAIIALIATPIILGIIKDTKKEADQRSVEMYEKALKNAIAKQQLDGSTPITGTFYTDNGKNLYLEDGSKTDLIVEYDGPEITIDRIDIYADGSVYIEGIKDADNKTLANSVGTKQRYIDGEEVYIDVTTGKSCTNYHVDNSKTGYNGLTTTKTTDNQNSCLKFYAFLDDGGKNLNLLLDHNTTAKLAWNSSNSNVSGPNEVYVQLKTDTNGWSNEIVKPNNYTYNHATRSYTINYSEYKARLITAQEIAQITGADKVKNWDETSTESVWYYFHDYSQDATTGRGDVCKTGGCQYGWLYDRTATNCTDYGCLNNAVGQTSGYWTSSAHASNSYDAWRVNYNGNVHNYGVYYPSRYGVRPVITILKSNI